jgi:hypothetical protein
MAHSIDRTFSCAGFSLLLASGCGAANEWGDGQGEVDVSSDAVVGGTNVTQLQNGDVTRPFGPTVRIIAPLDNDNSALFPREFGVPAQCSGVKIAPRRYLTGAHCVDTWNGSATGQVYITNDPTLADRDELDATFRYTVTKVRVHPSWLLGIYSSADNRPDQIGRAYDIAMFEVSKSNTIPQLVADNAVKINPNDVTHGTSSQLVGYGSSRKAFCDNTAVRILGDATGVDEAALPFTHFLWQGPPGGQAGDSGAPVFNNLSGSWWLSGVVSGPVFNQNQTRISRAEPLINWIRAPAPISAVNGQSGYLINGSGPFCLTNSSSNFASQWACYAATSSTDPQYWTLQQAETSTKLRLRNGASGKCLAAQNSTDGSTLVQQTCDTSNTNEFQKWFFFDRGALKATTGDTAPGVRFYQILNWASGKCIASFNGSRSQGQLMHQYQCLDSVPPATPQINHQAWVFTR